MKLHVDLSSGKFVESVLMHKDALIVLMHSREICCMHEVPAMLLSHMHRGKFYYTTFLLN